MTGSPTPPTVAVETSEMTKRFHAPRGMGSLWGPRPGPDLVAVDRVTLVLREGEIFGLVGPNGAGKTTLIKMLCGLYLPDSGWARICGHDTVHSNSQTRRFVGLVTSNERSFFWRLTGIQNLEFFANLYRIPPREARAWIRELLDLLDLLPYAHARFDGYSTGTKQRFSLARGLLSKPRVVFMDEPTKGVDPTAAAHIVEVIRERVVRLWSPTILITSHNLHEIERLCERVAVMDRGRIVASGALRELKEMAQPRDTYTISVRNVPETRLRELERIEGVERPVRITSGHGTSEIEMHLRHGAGALAHVLRALVEAGGEIERCVCVEPTFDDAFQTILDRAAGDGRPGGTFP